MQLLYSLNWLNLALRDVSFCFFLYWKFLSFVRFENVEDIEYNGATSEHTKEEFQGCFDQWKTPWNKSVEF